MVTDDILYAVQKVIDRFETEAEKNAGQAIWNMLSDFSEDEWEGMDDEQKTEWIGKYIPKVKRKYYTISGNDVEKLYERMKKLSDTITTALVIVLDRTFDNKTYVNYSAIE